MKLLDKFEIVIAKLGLGQHKFSYKIDDEFFELFDYGLVDHGDLDVEVDFEKKTSFIAINYQIKGTVRLICDRSLEEFDYQLNTVNKVILKYGEGSQELSDEIEIIPFNTQQFNIARHIYEYIMVAIPMKKLHPRYSNEGTDDQVIYSSSKSEEDEDSEIDPRWSELKKLKNKRLK